jgi:hypothetical protein
MTRDRDIERVLDRFYAEGPSEVPDRLLLGVFDRIERIPQRRLAFRLTRFVTMNSNLRLAAAAAIVVAVVGVGAFALSQKSSVGPPATASPSASASGPAASFEPTSLPEALQGRWVGAPRVVPEVPEPPYRNALLLSGQQLTFALAGQGLETEFASIAALVAPDQLRLIGATTDGGCKPRDEGTYSFTLDASGTSLTLTPISDACGPRAAALSGDWTHVGCTDDQGWCLGDLAPGTHHSTIFTPLVPAASWQFRYGQFSYTVPAAWRNVDDGPWGYYLAEQGAPENTGIYVWSEAAAHAQADQCTNAPEPGVGPTADEIVTWLTTLPGLVATNPQPVTIGGLNGKLVDLSVSPTWTASCPYAYSPGLPLVSTFAATNADAGPDWNVQGEGRTRIIALDLGDGRALIIDIEAQNKADYDALLPDAMQVVNTFTFNR